jgi:hypothetical protein
VRTILHALKYLMASRGVAKAQCKQVLLALRAQLVKMIDNDLQFVHPDDNGQRVCRMACSQLVRGFMLFLIEVVQVNIEMGCFALLCWLISFSSGAEVENKFPIYMFKSCCETPVPSDMIVLR